MFFPKTKFCDSMSNPSKEISVEGHTQRDLWQEHTDKMHKHSAASIYFSFIKFLTHFAEDLCHLKCSCGVHVGSDDGDASVGLFGVAECEGPLKVHLRVKRNWKFV